MHMKMSRRAETATAAAIPPTAAVLREEPLLEMGVVVLCWLGLVGVVETISRDSDGRDVMEIVIALSWIRMVGIIEKIASGSEEDNKMEVAD